MKGADTKLNKMVEKNNLYKLYEAGLIQIVDNAHINEDGYAELSDGAGDAAGATDAVGAGAEAS